VVARFPQLDVGNDMVPPIELIIPVHYLKDKKLKVSRDNTFDRAFNSTYEMVVSGVVI